MFERTRLRRKNVLRSLKSFPLSSIIVFPSGITRPKLSSFNVYNRPRAVFTFPDVVTCKNQKGEGGGWVRMKGLSTVSVRPSLVSKPYTA